MKEDAYELNELIEIKRGELIRLKEINHDLLETLKISLKELQQLREVWAKYSHKITKGNYIRQTHGMVLRMERTIAKAEGKEK